MKHQQILDKLSARFMVKDMDENFARAVTKGMQGPSFKGYTPEWEDKIWTLIRNRWDCALQAEKEDVSDSYKQISIVAIAVLGHKYGLNIDKIRDEAFNAIDELNKNVILSDDFERKSPAIKEFLKTPPVSLKRKPAMPETITFYRPEDVVSIQYKGKFYVAYIHSDTGINETPIIEFYDEVFDKIPTMEILEDIPAKGRNYDDATIRIEKFAVYGMKFLPDPANQIKLIASGIKTPPKNDHLEKSIGLFRFCDIFEIGQCIESLFHK